MTSEFRANADGGEAAGPGKDEGGPYGWLEEIDVPENSHMDGIEYLGPQIVEPCSP